MIRVLILIFLTGCSTFSNSPTESVNYVCEGREIIYDVSISDGKTISFRRGGVLIDTFPLEKCSR